MLVISMDWEQLDLATLHATFATFVERVEFLFKRGGCITFEINFTQHCLTLLSTRQLQVLEKDAYRVLPIPRDQDVQQYVLRMS